MGDLAALAQAHRESSQGLTQRPLEALLLWYADLGLEVDEDLEQVEYHCPGCGTPMTMALGLFLLTKGNTDLRCVSCGGDPADRGGE
jgi:hypothetical protein